MIVYCRLKGFDLMLLLPDRLKALLVFDRLLSSDESDEQEQSMEIV